ncbi:NADH dehydrogenase [ubiquinone] 1 alpha subcomplex assembly factor 4 [Adelges cooleyi]|uniref:NADH dehydrogenase [ubiquinone] 1 alpha subcomplex assembly factor 4 n=1 Tax=Adelges cooleyi TaxID=133065 RepID=UPI00217F8AC1|nr:NADH dehydrogenase [ubiquinone] 1 alpha subcomplex assembly factor 4 [Adelges cooleyi]
MGIVGSHLTRNLRRFNVVGRTERVIDKEKPTRAPLHKADAERIKQMIKDDPKMKEELLNKSSVHEGNLKDVYVTSTGDLPDVYTGSKAKLPKNREQVFASGFLMEEPTDVPKGRYTLTQIVQCISDHHGDKNQFTAEILAKKINIDVKTMENILKYYRVFDIHIPDKSVIEKQTSSPKQALLSIFNSLKDDLMLEKPTKKPKAIEKD